MSSLPDSSLAPSSAASETFAQSSSVNHGAAATPTTRSSSSNHHHHHHHHHHQGSGSSSNNNRARKNREEEVRVSQEGNEETLNGNSFLTSQGRGNGASSRAMATPGKNGGGGTGASNSWQSGAITGGAPPGGRRGQMLNANYLLNFQYDPIPRPPPRAPPPRRQRRIEPYNKELFLQANFRFLVSDLGDYMLNASDPDKMLQWEDVAAVNVTAPEVQCPICLDSPPLCPQITSCGHMFCFPCILRYLMAGEEDLRGDHWKKCPLCFAMISCKDLRTLSIDPVQEYHVGDRVRFNLLTRAKGSIIPFGRREGGLGALAYSKDGRCHLYSKFTLTSNAEQTTDKAVAELMAWSARVEVEGSEDLEMLLYVHAAVDELQQRKQVWSEHRTLDFLSSSPPVRQHDDEEGNAYRPTRSLKSNGQETELVNVDEDSSEILNTEGNEGPPADWEDLLLHPPETDEPSVVINNTERKEQDVKKDQDERDSYTFYQSADGQSLILHPLNVKCLLQHYGDYEALPSNLEAQVVELESVTQTDATRKRYRYLSHLPLTATFQLCEVDLSDMLPTEAFSPFAEEIRSRQLRRKHRMQQEREEKAKQERMAAVAASRPRPPSPTDFVTYMASTHIDDGLSFNGVDYAVGEFTPPIMSPPSVDERALFSQVTKLGYASGYDAPQLTMTDAPQASASGQSAASCSTSGRSSRGATLSFADVIQAQAAAKEPDEGSTPGKSAKKGKKASKVLLSTAGGRRY
ncbi:unnamed protein product [Sphagnum troendelagicum]